MPAHLAQLVNEVEAAAPAAYPDEDSWHASRGEGKWTCLELLGHLIDSASNNHQRFVRALAQSQLNWPGYDQISHVSVQNYKDIQPGVCLALWAGYNRFLSHLIAQITPAKESTPCAIDGAPEMPLSDLALDYVAHLEHHLKQLFATNTIHYTGMPWPPADKNRQWPK